MAVIISGTSGITTVNGTAAAPAITGTDTDTGIVYGTNTLFLATGGTTAVTVDSSQNVGIGTSSPASKLDVAGAITSSGNTNPYLALNNGTATSYLQVASGALDMRVGGANPITFNTNGSERARIDSSGNLLVGTTTLDGGFTCNKTASFAGNIYPAADNNGWNCGTAAKRWQTVYAVTGTINTSDARLKTAVRSLVDSEIAAAKQIAAEVGAYKWLDAIEAKGEQNARSHIGLTVQKAIQILEQNGLNPFEYGFICFDEWEEQVSEDGTVIQEAGNRYSFRTDELSLFIARGQQEAIQEQQALITQLQADVAALKGQA